MRRTFIAGLAIFVIVVSGCSTKYKTLTHKKPVLPQKLATLKISNVIKGAEAVNALRKMHEDNSLVFKQAFIGTYAKNSSQSAGSGAIVWLSVTGTEQSNRRLLDLMTNKINKGNTPFSKPDKEQVEGQTVYHLFGMGQDHYYFANGKKLIWLAVDEANKKRAIEELVLYLR